MPCPPLALMFQLTSTYTHTQHTQLHEIHATLLQQSHNQLHYCPLDLPVVKSVVHFLH